MRSNVHGHARQSRPHVDVAGQLHFLTRVTSSVFSASVVKDLVANSLTSPVMPRFYEPDLGANPDSPFARDASGKLIRRSYWLDMTDRTLVMVMVNGIGAHLTNDEKRAHLIDLKRDHLVDQVCVQEICRRRNKFVSVRADRMKITIRTRSTFPAKRGITRRGPLGAPGG